MGTLSFSSLRIIKLTSCLKLQVKEVKDKKMDPVRNVLVESFQFNALTKLKRSHSDFDRIANLVSGAPTMTVFSPSCTNLPSLRSFCTGFKTSGDRL